MHKQRPDPVDHPGIAKTCIGSASSAEGENVHLGAGRSAGAETLLASLEPVELNEAVARRAVALRPTLLLKLPDAIVLATAESEGASSSRETPGISRPTIPTCVSLTRFDFLWSARWAAEPGRSKNARTTARSSWVDPTGKKLSAVL